MLPFPGVGLRPTSGYKMNGVAVLKGRQNKKRFTRGEALGGAGLSPAKKMRALAKEVEEWGDPSGNERPHVCLIRVFDTELVETFKNFCKFLIV